MEEFQDCTSNRKYKAEITRLTEHLEEAPFRDITATILEASAKVLGFSQKSKSLKGTHVKVLRDAAAAITAGANVLAMQMAQDKCGCNLDLIEELRTENVGLKTSLKEVRKELEEVKEMLRGIREAPLQVAVSSPPSKQPGNADQSLKKAQLHMAGAPSPLVRVEKERAITPPMVDMMEEEEIPVGVIEVQKGLIPREKRRPIKEARVAKAAEAGPKIREDILLNKKVRLERKKEEPTKKGLEEEVSKMVFKALNKWSSQEKETPKRGARKGNKESKGKEMEKESVPHEGNKYMQEYPQLPPTRAQRREHQEQIEKEGAPTSQGEKWSKIKTRMGATGALILEIPGEERGKQADLLAEKLKEVLTDRAKVSRPQKMGELRIKGMEISTTESEAAEVVARVGGCRVGEVKTAKMREAWNRYRTLWVQCPLAAAKKVAELGNIKIGWTQTKVELLQARALQCFKCLERGHVQINCTSNSDRRANCYRCGEPGHLARDCSSRARCQICEEAGVKSGHRMGGPSCRSPKGKKKISGDAVEGGNLHRARQALPLFEHTMTERGAGLGIAAEPHHVPRNHRWFGDEGGSVAIVWKASNNSPPAKYVDRGRGFVVARWGVVTVVGVYLPPEKSLGLVEYKSRLQEMGDVIKRHLPGPVIVAGDFNAKSELWGSRRDDRRGEVTADWAVGLGLHIMNDGKKFTFVGSRGESIIDLSWATPSALRRVRTWRVAEELESLSDHLIIEMELSVTPDGLRPRNTDGPRPGRWALAQLNREDLEISLMGSTWPQWKDGQDLDSEVMEVMQVLALACDASMPRVRACPKRCAWWWTDQIAALRRRSVHLRRAFRAVRRDADPEVTLAARREFCAAAKELRNAIGVARGKEWDDLLLSLDADPWGRPYRMVMQKLRPWAPPLTETLDSRFLGRVMGTLFPVEGDNPITPYVTPSPNIRGRFRKSPRRRWPRLPGGSRAGKLRDPMVSPAVSSPWPQGI
ncbi:uncharacterized protein LOC112588980 [Harpegnathos saltator]|uniref:uncharacterized protein LOC112588980 n=1 Tax=Harpegnathos saltator TaxID=610380 RepID=UPI000DBEF237|nr:uncharacterized protein LOC112588980 [Harpegnathos saltator]